MNTESIEFPTIESPEPAAAPATSAIVVYTGMSALAVAPLQAMEAALKELAERYRDVAFDLKTTKGLNEAKAARNELREQGRYAVQRAMNTFKSEANEAKRDIEALAEKMVAITLGTENAIDKDIKARESEIEADKKAKAEAAAKRVAEFEGKISDIRSFLTRARGLPSFRIANGIEILAKMTFPAEAWAEYAVPAANAQCETLEGMNALHQETVLAEMEAARIEAQRLENERVAAEQAERQRALDAQAAELKRQQDEIAALRAQAEAQRLAEEKRVEEQARAAEHYAEQAAAAEAQKKANAEADIQAAKESWQILQPATEALKTAITVELDNTPPPVIELARVSWLKLGWVCDSLGFRLTEAFIGDMLGIAAKGRDKNAVLYHDSDFDLICEALIKHIKAVQAR